MTRSILSALLLGSALASPALADDVHLRAQVTVAHDANRVTLADIATLSGDHAQALAATIVAELPERMTALTLDVPAVRARLTDAGVHWGRVNLSGRRTVVTRAAAPAVRAMQPRSLEPGGPIAVAAPRVSAPPKTDIDTGADDTAVLAAKLITAPTLRGAIARAFVRTLERSPDEIRLRFAGPDAVHLDGAYDDLADVIVPRGSLRAARVVFRPRRGGVDAAFTVTAFPEVRTDAVVLTTDLPRASILGSAQLAPRTLWRAPLVADTLCPPGQATGKVTTRRLHEGDLLRRIHVELPIVVQRGDILNVRCLVGGTVITLQAEARDDGAEGETIALRRVGERNSFTARVAGPGEAIVDLAHRN